MIVGIYKSVIFEKEFLHNFPRIINDVVYVEWSTQKGTVRKKQHELAKGYKRGNNDDVEIMNFYR